MKDKKLTMSDIAKMCDVSKSTISRYFNGGYVKEETKEKIKEIIEKNNYEPNAFAQSLKAKKSNIIGLIAPCLDSTTSSRMLMSMDEYLRNQGYTTIIINTNHDQNRELLSMENLWRMNVDGIILLSTFITKEHRKLVKKIDIPVIFVGQQLKEGISIVNDDYSAGVEIGKYAVKMGHKDIVYLGVWDKDEAVGSVRKKGILDGINISKDNKIEILETDFSFDKTTEVVKNLLKRKRPTLIICATDNIAMAAYKEIRGRGLSIPEDISVIGFGGYTISSLLTPSLCTIRFDNELAGNLAGETIVKLLNNKTVPKKQIIGYYMIEGESVKCLI